jgi:type IV pilus assembly protein PilM
MFRGRARIGFDWSGTNVKAVRVLVSGGRARLTHVAWGPAAAVARAAGILRQAGIRGGRGDLRASLPEGELHVREIEVPMLGEAELEAALPFEVRRHVPLPQGIEWALAHQVTAKDASFGRVSVLAAVAPRADVETHRISLSRLGMRPSRVEAAPLAALNHALRACASRANRPCRALLDIGERGSWLAIHQEGCPLFCRRLEIGGDSFTLELIERCSVGREDAERIKSGELPLARVRHEWREKAPVLAELVSRSAGDLVENARVHIDAYRQRYGPVRDLYLSGGGALLRGLDLVLDRRLGIPVRVVDPFESLELPDFWPERRRDLLRAQGALFVTAVGLTSWWDG